jgi:uncharacterized membrane protein YciS (DUF1049 family)
VCDVLSADFWAGFLLAWVMVAIVAGLRAQVRSLSVAERLGAIEKALKDLGK